MSVTQIAAPEGVGECDYLDCPLWDSGEDEDADIRRCGTCKFQYYCSESCQKKDWKNHKHSCSSLNVDAATAFLSPDLHERQTMSDVVIKWFESFEKLPREVLGNRNWKASSIPESKAILNLNITSASSYKRQTPLQEKKPYRLPLVLICRRFLSDMFAPLIDESKKVIVNYLTTCGQNPPQGKGFGKIYGPKILAKPADLSPAEYNFWMTLAPIIAAQDYGALNFTEWQKPWRALATARVFLWDDDN